VYKRQDITPGRCNVYIQLYEGALAQNTPAVASIEKEFELTPIKRLPIR